MGTDLEKNQKGLKTDRSRRKKVMDLITQLSAKRNWTVDLAPRFIRERYELARKPNNVLCFPTARSFCDFLQKKRGDGEMNAIDEFLRQLILIRRRPSDAK
jgi:hypothetical protein